MLNVAISVKFTVHLNVAGLVMICVVTKIAAVADHVISTSLLIRVSVQPC